MKTKRLLITVTIFILFILIWFSHNSQFLGVSSQQSLFMMNNSAFGYSSIMAYTLFYVIPFLIFFNHLFLSENTFIVIRWFKRKKLYRSVVLKIMIASFIFSMILILTNLLFTSIFLDWNLLIKTKFIYICFFNMISLFLFYLSVGLLYRSIYDINNSVGFSIFLSYSLLGILFFIGKLVIPLDNWDPLKDLVVMSELLDNQWTTFDLLFVYFRQFTIAVIFYLVGSYIISRKDFI